MDFDVNKICRVCLEEGVLTSLFSTEFAMMPSDMMMLCAKIKIMKGDSMPPAICNNCIYRLGVAYHFKQQCENSDMRLRQYLSLDMKQMPVREMSTMTEVIWPDAQPVEISAEENKKKKIRKIKSSKQSRYKRKSPEECKKRAPKTVPKIPQTCYECHKTFKCAAQLQMHIRTHTGERPFACTYCPRRFAQKHNLSIHVRTHTGEKPFQCEICSKQFSALGNFQAHQKIHKGIRDQICAICNKGFISTGDLTRHMVTHTGIRNHHCDVCGKAFTRSRDMTNHKKKVHLNERQPSQPVTLGGLEAGINTSDTLNHNHSSITTNHMHKCPVPDCPKLLPSATALSSHYRTHTVGVPSLPNHPMAIPINMGVGSGIGISHPQSTIGMMHPQRLHPY